MKNNLSFIITKHARRQAGARGLASCLPAFILFLLENGKVEYDGDCRIIHLRDKTQHRQYDTWAREHGIKHASKVPPYIVLSKDGAVVTNGWRYERVKHNYRAHLSARRPRRGSKRGERR